MIIDLPPKGKAGIDAKLLRPGVVYIEGSNHWRDWLHHVLPGAKRREIEAAEQIARAVYDLSVTHYVVGGHSLGGAIACLVAALLRKGGSAVECYTFGAKRPPICSPLAATHYRHRGDIVPFLPPFRQPIGKQVLIGKRALPWKAHSPRVYSEVRRKVGLL